MKWLIVGLVFFLFSFSNILAQIGINTDNPHKYAALHIHGKDKGVLIPIMDSIARNELNDVIPKPEKGLLARDTTVWKGKTAFFYWDGDTWILLNPLQSDELDKNTVRLSTGSTTMRIDNDVTINKNLAVKDTIDATVINGFGTIPIGGIIMWNGETPPDGWVLCIGGNVSDVRSPLNANPIPDLREKFIVGYNPNNEGVYGIGETGGEAKHALTSQEQVFVQFKGYLANTKINALSAMMNQVLTDLGSDLRVNLSGYTTLKTGGVREKISVSITRDGIDVGSFGKCSAGEAARINLASLLAMQRLVNGNAGFGKGLDLLVLDEILEAVDESGLSSIFEALNGLGITALVVSHGLVNEGYTYKLTVVKENGQSRIGA